MADVESAVLQADNQPGELTLAQAMLPSDANPLGNVHGGVLMKLADTAGGIAAIRHARRPCVTVVMDSMTFEQPVYVGNLVMLYARVTWTGRTSLETEVTVQAEDIPTGQVRRISSAYFVYVAIDEHGRPAPLRQFEPRTAAEKQRWTEAEERRAFRLSRAGAVTA